MEQIWHEGKRRLGMQLLVREGMFSNVMFGMTSAFLVAFALALGADALYIGLLNAIPNFFWTIALVPSALLTQKYIAKRKSILVSATVLSRIMWLGILMLPIAFVGGSLAGLMVFVALASVMSAFSSPAWASLTADIVPDSIRGRYFSRRLVYTTITGLCAQLVAGYVLDWFGINNLYGFVVVFAVGLVSGLVSAALLWSVPEPPAKFEHKFDSSSSMKHALKDRRLLRFLFIFGFFEFSVMIAAPFFTVHLLKALQADYIWISILAVAGGLAGIMVQRAWGRFSDRYGHRVIIIISAFWILFVPLLWIPVQPSQVIFLIVVEAFSGAVWAGFTLSQFNYILEISPPEQRPVYSALSSVMLGVAGIAGPIIGGLLAEAFTTAPIFGIAGMTDMRAVFFVSGALRIVAAVLFGLFLMEVVEKRERVAPTHIFSEMIRSGLLGGALKTHNAAGSVISDASAARKGLKGTAAVIGKDVAKSVHALNVALEHISTEADKSGDRISGNVDKWEIGKKKEEKKVGNKLKVKASV